MQNLPLQPGVLAFPVGFGFITSGGSFFGVTVLVIRRVLLASAVLLNCPLVYQLQSLGCPLQLPLLISLL